MPVEVSQPRSHLDPNRHLWMARHAAAELFPDDHKLRYEVGEGLVRAYGTLTEQSQDHQAQFWGQVFGENLWTNGKELAAHFLSLQTLPFLSPKADIQVREVQEAVDRAYYMSGMSSPPVRILHDDWEATSQFRQVMRSSRHKLLSGIEARLGGPSAGIPYARRDGGEKIFGLSLDIVRQILQDKVKAFVFPSTSGLDTTTVRDASPYIAFYAAGLYLKDIVGENPAEPIMDLIQRGYWPVGEVDGYFHVFVPPLGLSEAPEPLAAVAA